MFAIWRLRNVTRLGVGLWQEVTGIIRAALKPGAMEMELQAEGAPAVGVRFSTRGISFFAVPTAGSTFALRLAGDGNGKVLVALPGHWGESLGTIWRVPLRDQSSPMRSGSSGK